MCSQLWWVHFCPSWAPHIHGDASPMEWWTEWVLWLMISSINVPAGSKKSDVTADLATIARWCVDRKEQWNPSSTQSGRQEQSRHSDSSAMGGREVWAGGALQGLSQSTGSKWHQFTERWKPPLYRGPDTRSIAMNRFQTPGLTYVPNTSNMK